MLKDYPEAEELFPDYENLSTEYDDDLLSYLMYDHDKREQKKTAETSGVPNIRYADNSMNAPSRSRIRRHH